MPVADSVQFVDLARSFGDFEAVRGISMEIPAGETFGLLGPNGAGKTTTLLMLSTLLAPTRGDVVVFGASVVQNPAEVRRRVGLAPQQISLYPTLTAQENLEFFGKLHGIEPRTLEGRVDRLLDMVGLTPRRDDLVRTYSGGMQRRLNLACSMVHHPRLLLLDEPTANVDPQSRENLLEVIQQIAASGTTVFYTTHYIEEAERICDRIAIIDHGRIVGMGTLRELLGGIGMGEVIEIRSAVLASDAASLAGLDQVVKIEHDGELVRIYVKDAASALSVIPAALQKLGDQIESLEVYRISLERVFMDLTGRALRD